MSGGVTIGALKRLSLYMAGQLKSAVAITGGSIAGTTMSGNTVTSETNSGGTFSTANLAVNVSDGSSAANLANNGYTKFGDETTVATTYTMDAPSRAGIVKMLRSEQGDTLIRTVIASGASFNDTTTNTRLTFDTNAEAVLLVAESTSVWGIASNTGSVGLSS